MCGRFTLAVELSTIIRIFQAQYNDVSFDYSRRYNIAPSQNVMVVTQTEGARQISPMSWGLIPHWSKDTSIANKLINARAETIDQKPSYKLSFLHRRCLIPADGFYEWKKKAGGKIPMRITLLNQEVFAFAGIWDKWQSPQGRDIYSCSIITSESNDQMRNIHNRMPVILSGESTYHAWLTSKKTTMLKDLMQPYGGPMIVYPVTGQVNSPQNDFPALIEEKTVS